MLLSQLLKWNGICKSLGQPTHGIAIPADPEFEYTDSGKVFCVLPVAKKSNLPVNINGQFGLTLDNYIIWN